MIVDKIDKFLEQNKTTEVNKELFDEYGKETWHAFERQFLQEKVDRPSLRLSSLGKCVKQQAFIVSGTEKDDDITPRNKRTFYFGDIAEVMVVSLAKYAGVNLHSEQKKVKMAGVVGHIDGIVTDDEGDDILFECKSMSDFAFQRFKKTGIDDSWGYVSQMNAYMEGLGLEYAVIVGYNKNNGHLHEEVIMKDPAVIARLASNVGLIKNLEGGVLALEDVPRKYEEEDETYYRKKTGNKKLPIQCSYCSYRKSCWSDIRTVIKAGKPVYYTELNNLLKGSVEVK